MYVDSNIYRARGCSPEEVRASGSVKLSFSDEEIDAPDDCSDTETLVDHAI